MKPRRHRNPRRRPAAPCEAWIDDAACIGDLSRQPLLRGTPAFVRLVNQSLRDLRAARDELDTAA